MGPPRTYLFGDFELKVAARILFRGGKQIPLGSKAFEVLTCLLSRPGEAVTKDELLKAVWPDAFVEEGNLTQQISALRKALGDSSSYIVTIPGKGYQFVAEVKVKLPSPEQKPAREIAAKAERPNLFVVESRPRTAVQPVDEEEEDAPPAPRTGHENAAGPDQVDEAVLSVGRNKERRGRSQKYFWWVAGIPVAALVAVVGYLVIVRERRTPFQHFTIQKATDAGNVPFTAISPDGVYLASVLEDAEGNESLWVHHVPTGSERPILQDPAFHYGDVKFSPDGNFVYFRACVGPGSARNADGYGQSRHCPPAEGQVRPGRVGALEDKLLPTYRKDVYRIPILGGEVARIVEGVDAQVSFIDKGQRLCFYRENRPATYAFLSAAAGGGDERVLFTGKAPYPVEAACSPDGRRAVVEDSAGNVEVRNFDSGSTQMLLSSGRYSGYFYFLVWDPKGKGIFATELTRQITFLSYPGGVLRPITTDLSEYIGISVTANADVIAATQMERNSTFDEISLTEPSNVQAHLLESLHWFLWVDSRTILTSDVNGVFKTVDLGDGRTITLNVAKERAFVQPAPCGADTIVASGRGPGGVGRIIYRMNLDGSAATPVTPGKNDLLPECAPDGKWLFYNDNHDPKNSVVVRAPLSGGAAQTVTDGQWSSVSPDGKMIAVVDGKSGHLGVFSTDTLQQLHSIPLPSNASPRIAFSADSKSVFYVSQPGNESVIWRQALDGSAPVKIADIPRAAIYWLRASPDGSKLGLTVMTVKHNAVLLHDIR